MDLTALADLRIGGSTPLGDLTALADVLSELAKTKAGPARGRHGALGIQEMPTVRELTSTSKGFLDAAEDIMETFKRGLCPDSPFHAERGIGDHQARAGKLADLTCLSPGPFCLSGRGLAALGLVLRASDVVACSIDGPSGGYHALCVPVLDALSDDTEYWCFDPGGLGGIERHAFKLDAVRPMFRVRLPDSTPATETFVTEEFIDTAAAAKLTGFSSVRVWTG